MTERLGDSKPTSGIGAAAKPLVQSVLACHRALPADIDEADPLGNEAPAFGAVAVAIGDSALDVGWRWRPFSWGEVQGVWNDAEGAKHGRVTHPYLLIDAMPAQTGLASKSAIGSG